MTQTRAHPLARLMAERGLSQEQLGVLLGFSQQRVSQLLLLSKRPSRPLLDRITRRLGVEAALLVDEAGQWR